MCGLTGILDPQNQATEGLRHVVNAMTGPLSIAARMPAISGLATASPWATGGFRSSIFPLRARNRCIRPAGDM